MSQHTTLSSPTDFYTLLGILQRGYEVTIMHAGHRFLLKQDGQTVIVTIEGEEHHFVGCTEREIRDTINEWFPGAWK